MRFHDSRRDNVAVLSIASAAALVISTVAWSLVHVLSARDSAVSSSRQGTVLTLGLVVCVLAAVLTLVASVPSSKPRALAYVAGSSGIVGGVLGTRSDDPLAVTVGYIVVISAIALISSRFLQANS